LTWRLIATHRDKKAEPKEACGAGKPLTNLDCVCGCDNVSGFEPLHWLYRVFTNLTLVAAPSISVCGDIESSHEVVRVSIEDDEKLCAWLANEGLSVTASSHAANFLVDQAVAELLTISQLRRTFTDSE
jgi:hypothetical protein